jgi:branched-chain amino acid transport system ATP-binding protein
VHKQFGDTRIICGATLTVRQGERHAIIGPNGAGKSTLFNLISSRLAPTSGQILLNGRSIVGLRPFQVRRLGLSRNFQVTNIFPELTVFENIRCGVTQARGFGYSLWHSIDGIRAVRERTLDVLEEIGLAEQRNRAAALLSYADQRALEIGLAICGGYDVLLLDEPAAGMSRTETVRAGQLIRKVTEGKSLLLVEHDMGMVFDLADRVSVLVQGNVIATDTPTRIRENSAVQEAYLGRPASARVRSAS